ncbi:MAG TPA: TonB-dependent receptor [Candidatus Acidoferrales bacterium]|nr:TonB-dependent receptor [Candidatus Acidoferrales bacterium]
MKGRSGLLFAVLAIAVLLVGTSSAFAQGGAANAQLNGTVTDSSGGSVAGAAITVRETDTNTTYTTTSNDRGFYTVANLPPGKYELKASFTGFANYTQTGITLEVGQAATINVALQVASAGEKVVVTTEVPTIEPTKTEISQVVESQQIQSLPINGRLFTDFALLTPGVATSRTSLGTSFTEYEVTQISFGGMRSFSNEVTVDGADFVNAASGVQRATPPQESVQEFRVVNNSFGAESGRALGGIVNIVTKGGTNDLHGSIYEYLQNNAADSRNLLQKPEPGLQSVALPHALRQNQFGATLGGPIVKDKTFFFANYEGKRRAESPLYPPDLVNNLQVIDAAKAQMGLAPEGCTTGLASCTLSDQTYLNKFLKTADNDYGFARLDHQINSNNRLALRYNVEDSRSLNELVGQTLDGGGIGTPSGGRNLFIRDQSVVATLDSTLTPNVVNSVLAQYARRHYNFTGTTGQPDFSILNDLELGHNFGTNDRLYETRAQLGDSVSWVKGNHVAKFGFDGNYLSSLINFPGFTPVRMLVPTGATAASCLAAFSNFEKFGNAQSPSGLAASAGCPVATPQTPDNGVVFAYFGVPLPTSPTACTGAPPCAPTVTAANAASLGVGPPNWSNAFPPSFFPNYGRLIDHGYWGAFAQDQWRITPNLTLNYGLRWDVESGLTSYVKNDYNEWQPRLGLAWSPDSKTVVRAGFGMFFDRQNLTFFFVPNTQKVVAGYQCGNHPTAAIANICNNPGTDPFNMPYVATLPQEFPNIQANTGQAKQGYQIFGFPAAAGAAANAASVIQTGGYDTAFPAISMAGTCASTLACGIGEGGMDHNARTPYAEQASLELDHQFGRGLAVNVGYLFVGAHKLVRGNNINVPCPVGTTDLKQPVVDSNFWPIPANPATGGFPGLPAILGFPDWVPGKVNANGTFSTCPDITDPSGHPTLGTGALAGLGPWFQGAGPEAGLQTMSSGLEDYNNDVSNAIYHGGTVTVIERVKNFNMTANYTYSHTIDNGNFTTFINLPVNQFDFKGERANSNQDARHRFVANFTATGPESTLARHFTLSSIITLQSGRPFTMFYGANTLNDVAGGATDRVGGAPLNICTANCGSRSQLVCTTASNCSTMIGRNTYIGDPLYSWDFHLGRYFQLRERLKLDLSVDAFNLLNRSNVDEVTSVYGSPVFCGGVIPRRYRDATSRAIQGLAGTLTITCPNGGAAAGETPVCAAGPAPCGGASGPQVGNNANVPINSLPPNFGFKPQTIFIPDHPNANFGLPRTMLNPRQFQFAAKFTF